MSVSKIGAGTFPADFNDEEAGAVLAEQAVVGIESNEAEVWDDRLAARLPRLSLDFDLAVARRPRRPSPLVAAIIARARSLKPRHAARPR